MTAALYSAKDLLASFDCRSGERLVPIFDCQLRNRVIHEIHIQFIYRNECLCYLIAIASQFFDDRIFVLRACCRDVENIARRDTGPR